MKKSPFWQGFIYSLSHPILNARMCITQLLIVIAKKTCVQGFCHDHLNEAMRHEVSDEL